VGATRKSQMGSKPPHIADEFDCVPLQSMCNQTQNLSGSGYKPFFVTDKSLGLNPFWARQGGRHSILVVQSVITQIQSFVLSVVFN